MAITSDQAKLNSQAQRSQTLVPEALTTNTGSLKVLERIKKPFLPPYKLSTTQILRETKVHNSNPTQR